jgi:hypothetical protein
MVDRKTLVNLGPPFRGNNIGAFSLAATLPDLLLPLTAEAGKQKLNGIASQTILDDLPDQPSNYLQLVTFTATVFGAGGDPTGTVTFTTQNGSPLCVRVPILTGTDLMEPSNVATFMVNTSGAAHLLRPRWGGERGVVATLMGLGGVGLVGLVLLPFKLPRKAVGGVLFLVIMVLCFGTSCGTSFAPGTSSPPVNNTVYISVNAELREDNPLA